MEINIVNFFNWMESLFHMEEQIKRLPDKRKKKQISLEQLMKIFMIMGALCLRSIKQLDFIGRQKWAKIFTKSKRKQVASDSTIHRILSWISVDVLEEINYRCYNNIVVQDNLGIKLSSGKKVKVGAIDGSGFGKILASTFCMLGKGVDWFLGVEFMEKKGKELPAGYNLLKKLSKKFGKNFVDYIVADGLYSCRNFFNLCQKMKVMAIVKTSEEGLCIIQDAEGIFNNKKMEKEIEHVKGIDELRNKEYELWATDNFWMDGVKTPLKVVKVKEVPLKGKNAGKPEYFWIITQAIELSAPDLRELAHFRWHIENNGFKSFNEQCLSKNLFTHNSKARLALLRIQLLTYNIIQLFRKKSNIKQNKFIKEENSLYLQPFIEIRQLFWQSLEMVVLGFS